MKPAIVDRIPIYSGWCRLERTLVRMPDGEIAERHLEHHGNAVAVLPYDADRGVALLVKQPRASVLDAGGEAVFEVPAGRIESDSPDACARREVLEEAGLVVQDLVPVANIWSLIGISTERLQLYLARYSADDRVANGGGAEDENEGIEVQEVSLSHLGNLARNGDLLDAKTLILLQRLMLDRPELFA